MGEAGKRRKAEYNRRWIAANPEKRVEYTKRHGRRYRASPAGQVAVARNTRRGNRRRRIRRLQARMERGSTGRYVWVAGVCVVCGQAFVHWAPTKTCSTECSGLLKQRRSNERKRAKYRALRAAVCERDKWLCGICGDPVNRSAVVPEPDSPVIDHVLPRIRGGSDDLANLQCAHFYCNSVKGDRVGFTA